MWHVRIMYTSVLLPVFSDWSGLVQDPGCGGGFSPFLPHPSLVIHGLTQKPTRSQRGAKKMKKPWKFFRAKQKETPSPPLSHRPWWKMRNMKIKGQVCRKFVPTSREHDDIHWYTGIYWIPLGPARAKHIHHTCIHGLDFGLNILGGPSCLHVRLSLEAFRMRRRAHVGRFY